MLSLFWRMQIWNLSRFAYVEELNFNMERFGPDWTSDLSCPLDMDMPDSLYAGESQQAVIVLERQMRLWL